MPRRARPQLRPGIHPTNHRTHIVSMPRRARPQLRLMEGPGNKIRGIFVSMPRRARPQLRLTTNSTPTVYVVRFNAPKGSAPAETVRFPRPVVQLPSFQCPEGLGPS